MEALAVKVQEALGSRYRVERVAATGGMSTVLRAVDLKHDRVVAVKVLHDEVTDLVGTDRFLSEIQLVARLQHPHIVPLFDSGAVDGLLFYTMPFIDGETLRAKLRRCGPLGLNETLGIVRELCDALAYAHERDILHRDVKPENILLANGHALLTDFGVARAIHAASLDRHTGAGMAVGTVAYMSPEQASGEPVLDARSDVYSLGCVFYEMLAGVPPHEAPTPQALLAQRFRSAPKSLRAQRSDVNERLERVVRKALATAPNDRYADARAFANDLPITGDWSALHSKTTRRWPAIALGVLTAAAVSLGIRAVWNRWPIDEKIDASLYVVLPLSHEADRGQVAWRGDDCARMLFDAISRWTGIALVDEMRTRDAVEAEGGRITTLEQAVRVARRLRAGRLVWGSVVNAGGDTELRASVYDVVSRVPRAMAQERTRVASNGDVSPTISGVADSLIVRSALSRGSAQVSGSRNLEALTEYVAAHRALDRWELDTAYALFSSASSRDDGFAQAHLWAAQVASWLPGARASQVTAHASSALAAPLPEKLRRRARALLALGGDRFADACSEYNAMIARDSTDFIAWYGRGECLSYDRLVVRDASSPSSWRFRSSRHAGVEAYVRALTLVPSFQNSFGAASISRLERLLLATTNDYVRGYRLQPDTVEFAAFPALVADTLSAVPWPLLDFVAAVPGSQPPSYRTAIDRNRSLLVRVTERWANDDVQNAQAQEAFALALENVGRIDSVRGVPSALSQIHRAMSLSSANTRRYQLALIETRLFLKLGRWSDATRVSDALLSATDSIPSSALRPMAAVALMRGRVATSIELAKRSALFDTMYTASGARPLAQALSIPSYTLAAYAISGVAADSTRAWHEATQRALRQSVTPAEASAAREIRLNYPGMFAFPETGAFPEHIAATSNLYLRAESALTRGDSAGVVSVLDSIDRESSNLQAGDEGAEFVYLSAWLRRAVGDTTAAIEGSRRYRESLSATSRRLFDSFTGGAGIVRVLLLSADMAYAAGDRATARRDAEAVLTLWSSADDILQPQLRRMRSYLSQ